MVVVVRFEFQKKNKPRKNPEAPTHLRQSLRPGPHFPADTSGEAREEPRPTNAMPARQAPAHARTSPKPPRTRAAFPRRTPATVFQRTCAHPTARGVSTLELFSKVVVREHFTSS